MANMQGSHLPQIRTDLEACVLVDGKPLYAGDFVPEGARIGEWVLEPNTPRSRAKYLVKQLNEIIDEYLPASK